MQRNAFFLFFLAALSVLAGYLISRMNFIGRVGIWLMHPEYKFLRSWYKNAAAIFIIWMQLFLLQRLINRRLPSGTARIAQIAVILFAVLGLWGTYHNLHTDTTHKIIGEKIHLGFYLFWIGWIIIGFFMLSQPRKQQEALTAKDFH